jgi:hypothetical protein
MCILIFAFASLVLLSFNLYFPIVHPGMKVCFCDNVNHIIFTVLVAVLVASIYMISMTANSICLTCKKSASS